MRRYKRAIRGVALFTQQGNLSSTNNARIFKALNTVNSGQLRILGLLRPMLMNTDLDQTSRPTGGTSTPRQLTFARRMFAHPVLFLNVNATC